MYCRTMGKVTNYILPILIVLGSVPYKYVTDKSKMNLGLFIDRPINIANLIYYYIGSITAVVLIWMLYKDIKVNKRILRVILIIALIDLVCLFFFSGQLLYIAGLSDFGTAIKLTIALIIEYIYGKFKKRI